MVKQKQKTEPVLKQNIEAHHETLFVIIQKLKALSLRIPKEDDDEDNDNVDDKVYCNDDDKGFFYTTQPPNQKPQQKQKNEEQREAFDTQNVP